jgi:hypothetical protein
MNDIVLKDLARENISTELIVGQNIIPYLKDNEENLSNVLWTVANDIVTSVKKGINQITKYHDSKL